MPEYPSNRCGQPDQFRRCEFDLPGHAANRLGHYGWRDSSRQLSQLCNDEPLQRRLSYLTGKPVENRHRIPVAVFLCLDRDAERSAGRSAREIGRAERSVTRLVTARSSTNSAPIYSPITAETTSPNGAFSKSPRPGKEKFWLEPVMKCLCRPVKRRSAARGAAGRQSYPRRGFG